MAAVNQAQAKILKYLYQQGPSSRRDVGQYLQLGTSMTSDLVSELISQGLIVEKGTISAPRGRYPVAIALNPDFGCFIGIEMTNAYLRALITSFTGDIIGCVEQSLEENLTLETLKHEIGALIDGLRTEHQHIPLLACGLASYGLVNREAGMVLSLPPYKLQNIPLAEQLTQMIGVPVYLEARTQAAAIGELNHGIKYQVASFAYVNADYGAALGLACVDHGEVIRGGGLAGQFGHLCLDPEGPRCFCGGRGCLATMATPSVVVEQTLADLRPQAESVLNGSNGETITFNDIIAASINKDKLAVDIMTRLAENLGLGISYVVNLFNPDTVILGGLLRNVGADFIATLSRVVERHVIPSVFHNDLVQTTTMGTYGVALGAVDVAADKVIDRLSQSE
jgi:predicted NBD/HSP70 family sugar kinase